jgi:dipeptidyl aminopeptidase/acylaminoacyl peptidase
MSYLIRRVTYAALSLLLCSTFIPLVHAQDATLAPSAARVDQILAGISRGRFIRRVAISPDGRRLAWLLGGEIHVSPLDNLSINRPITVDSSGQSCYPSDFTWSPSSSALVLLASCGPSADSPAGDTDGLYLVRFDANNEPLAPVLIIALHGYVQAPAFSPDGFKVAFLYVEGATRPAGALAAQDLPSGVIGEDHFEVQRVAEVSVPPDWNGEPEPPPTDQRPVPHQARRLMPLFNFLTPANLHVYEFDWSPDSKSLAYIGADPPGENNWWVARLYTQSIGGSPSAILSPAEVPGSLHGLQIAVPRWSPDGKYIAFIGGLMSDQGSTGGDVYVVPLTGAHNAVNLTNGRHESAAWISWKIPGEIDYSALAGGFSQLRTLVLDPPLSLSVRNNVVGFQFPASIGDGRMEMSLSFSHGGWAFIKSSFSEPPEIWYARDVAAECAAPADNPNACYEFQQLSHFNEGLQRSWGESVSLRWTNNGFHIQGWLMLPRDYDPAKKYPLIVEVHGGPAAAVEPRWSTDEPLSPAVFSDLGYFVLRPNPRGSFGQGEAFTQANRRDFGYGDLRDILAGVDTVLARYPVDPNRIGITGWSYGGFMTMFAVTQTHRFRAGMAGAGISDWLSYYGENSIDQWMIPYFGASVYDDPAAYAKSSAINFIKNVTTPTLIVVGDRDGECPAPQSFEFWHALRDLHVPTELVVYPNEGHGLDDPAHRRDVLQRTVDWFAQYMP